MLKAELHAHTNEDPTHPYLKHNAKQLINILAKRKYKILAITNHDKFTYSESLRKYAQKKGIMLIPGIEKTIQGKHVVMLNANKKAEQIENFKELREYKLKNNMITLAAHPFFPMKQSLNQEFKKNIDLFDAIEYAHYYLSWLNYNKKAVQYARKHTLPLIGTSDAHLIGQLGHTYTIIKCEKNVDSFIDAVKKSKVKVITNPIPFTIFLWFPISNILNNIWLRIKKYLN